jgi:SAM-dependent methyltransferase
MSSIRVSVLLPVERESARLPATMAAISTFFDGVGFEHELIVAVSPGVGLPALPDHVKRVKAEGGHGALLKRAVLEASGDVLVVADPELPYPASDLGSAIAMIDAQVADLVFGSSSLRRARRAPLLLRWFLVDEVPDDRILLVAFTASAAKLLLSEAKLPDAAIDLEVAFLANKYGFRVERLYVQPSEPLPRRRRRSAFPLLDIIRIRMANRVMAYRAARRCPICYSAEVWTLAQIPHNLVRHCKRCKCRFLGGFSQSEEAAAGEAASHEGTRRPPLGPASTPERRKTFERRLSILRREVASQARILEVGAGDGLFGRLSLGDFEYVGIDPSPGSAREARARGTEVYCATLSGFVNTGPAFDAIALFHRFERFPDPHDALARMRDLLKPSGVLLLTAFDTESLLYLIGEPKLIADYFHSRLVMYSRSALIELLEHSGFEIVSVADELAYQSHAAVEDTIRRTLPSLAALVTPILRRLPDPILAPAGSIRILARRRVGPGVTFTAIRTVEPTHAR